MLGALLKEVVRGLRRESPEQAPVAPDASRRASFRSGDASTKSAMVDELKAQLSGGSAPVAEWTLLGDWQLTVGQYADAERSYRRALQADGAHVKAREGLGLSLLRQGALDEAYVNLDLASKAAPDDADILVHLGLVDFEMGNLPNAADRFQRAIGRAPSNVHAWHNLALVCLRQGAVHKSIEMLERALTLQPDHGLAHTNLALALRRDDRLREALQAAQRAVELKPGNARVWVVLADMQLNVGDFEASRQSLDRALTLDAHHVGTHVALGKLHAAIGEHAAARRAFERALQLNPAHADALGGLGELDLLLGHWTPGWDRYEARRRVEATPVRPYPYAEWQGEPLAGKTILVHAEQGMGDIILFAACLAQLQALGAKCVVEVRPRMASLFERSFPGATIVGRPANADLLDWPAELADSFDYQIPIGSLPRWFRKDAAGFEHTKSPYLLADPACTAHWRSQLDGLARCRVGIAWRGGVAGTAKEQRSLDCAVLAEALDMPGVQLVCLQYGDVQQDLKAAQARTGHEVHAGLSGLADLDDLAALTAACDCVVTVCSTQAHLTGALGKPGIVLVPSNPNWRYGHAGDTSLWYPSLLLARQPRQNDWTHPLQQARRFVEEQLTHP